MFPNSETIWTLISNSVFFSAKLYFIKQSIMYLRMKRYAQANAKGPCKVTLENIWKWMELYYLKKSNKKYIYIYG